MKSFGDAAKLFGQAAIGGYKIGLAPALDEIGRQVQGEVKREIGNYQPAIGPFPATAPLSQATLDSKAKKGQGAGHPDTPLYATGQFAADINYESDLNTLSVTIGTNTEYIKYTELGSGSMPPRPVFGPSCLRVMPHMLPMLAKSAFAGILGGVWSGLGIRATTFTASAGDNATFE